MPLNTNKQINKTVSIINKDITCKITTVKFTGIGTDTGCNRYRYHGIDSDTDTSDTDTNSLSDFIYLDAVLPLLGTCPKILGLLILPWDLGTFYEDLRTFAWDFFREIWTIFKECKAKLQFMMEK